MQPGRAMSGRGFLASARASGLTPSRGAPGAVQAVPSLGLELAMVSGSCWTLCDHKSPLCSSDHLEPHQASPGALGDVDRRVQQQLNHRPRRPGLAGTGCPWAAGHLSLLRACGLQEAAKPAGREKRAPWPLCSLWESGVSQMAGRGRDEGRRLRWEAAWRGPSHGAGPRATGQLCRVCRKCGPAEPEGQAQKGQ